MSPRGIEMINPIALVFVMLGMMILLFGAFWAARRSKAVGSAISLIGVIVAAAPFLVSLFLAR
jgi:membrane protein insertase Oxa1/YidC/SpoIIIJ